MEFWDEVYKKVSSAASYTAKETEKYTELAKIKFNLMREKSRLEDAYKNMGEIYYNQMKTSDTDEKKLSLAYDKIEKSVIEIERLNLMLDAINNSRVCSECGVRLDKTMEFCHKCGAKQECCSEEKVDEE